VAVLLMACKVGSSPTLPAVPSIQGVVAPPLPTRHNRVAGCHKADMVGTQYSRLVLGSMGNKLKMRSPLVWLLLSTSQLLGLGGVSLLQLFCWLLWMQSFVHYSNSSYCQGR
jgi:hypothetical protein